MNTLDVIIAMGSMIGAFVFFMSSCHLLDNDGFYAQRTKVALARVNVIIGVFTIVAFGYTMVVMQFDAVDQSHFVLNTVCSIFLTLLLAGIGLFLLSLNELPILRHAR